MSIDTEAVKQRKSDRRQRWLIRLILILFVIITIYPMIFVFLTSLKSTSEFYRNIWLWPEKVE